MVVSGVPWPRHDHVQALADLALDMADAAAELKDPHGRALPLRIGLATGPVVAGWWDRAVSSTTCGATPSTSRPGWSPLTPRAGSKCLRRSTNG
ncbi:adenylate and Guanylate cyclase catalytic domain protein [Mycobacterium xenopi 3993]|nr:adenylate and Guanylate cyclase catalytic domain protein [Mycobacterium xenopi 3993]